MVATTGYQAGLETNQTQLSYGVEATWGTAPATTFQAIRYVSESLSGSKQRNRPSEINPTREVSAAITVQEQAGGSINYALSYGTFDDFMSIVLGNDWGAAQTINAITTDLTITSGTKVLSSTLGSKFTNISAGQWIRLLGFTNAGNNGFWYVVSKADNSHLTLAGTGTITTESSTGAAQGVRSQTIANGTQFKSLYLQQKFSSALWLRYAGAFVPSLTLTGGVGQFLSGTINVVAQSEVQAVADVSTGGVVAAPTGKVHDPIGGFGGVLWNQAALSASVDSFTLNIENAGASMEFAMGSASAAGVMMGTLQVTGSMKMFFKGFTEYANFKTETTGNLAFITKDAAGNAYAVTLPNAALMNPKIEAGGPGQAVYASFDIEGNPASTGGTIVIDKLPAV